MSNNNFTVKTRKRDVFEKPVDRPRKKFHPGSYTRSFNNYNPRPQKTYKDRDSRFTEPEELNVPKKYELVMDDVYYLKNTHLFRIRALRDFGDVKKGDLGGYVQSERNLSHSGDCWLYNYSKCYNNGRVTKNAKLLGRSEVKEYATATDNVVMMDYSTAQGDAYLGGSVIMRNWAVAGENCRVTENATLAQHSVTGGHTTITGKPYIGGYTYARGNIEISGEGTILGGPYIQGSVKISGSYHIFGKFTLSGQAKITKDSDLMIFRNFWSQDANGSDLVFIRPNNIYSMKGFIGSDFELINYVKENDPDNIEIFKNIIEMVAKNNLVLNTRD